MANTDALQVVALALFNPSKRRYLIVRRNTHQTSGAGHWEFPGGKIETFESQTQALVREIAEELNLQILQDALKFVHSHTYQYPSKKVEIHLYRLECHVEEISLVDHDALAWVTPNEMLNYDLAPADVAFINYL